ncbi:MAG: HAMP domain-containing histidine kinase [Muribaculaceae bacterium]|nr:HAMP domain-containing histidine kinase [Muribaculaceae bacterium]
MATDLWNSLSYRRRLFLGLVGYSLVLVGCFLSFQYHREKSFKADELNSQLQLVNTYILNELAEGKTIGEMRLHEVSPHEDMRVSIIGSDGSMVYDNTIDSLPGDNHLDRWEIALAMKRGSGYTLRRHSKLNDNTYFYSARRGSDGTVVRTAVPYSVSLIDLLKADTEFLWVTGVITLLMCVIGFFGTRSIGENVTRLSRFAEKAEKGERISDVESFPHDELGEISNHIVRLYARLQQANADRDREHAAAMHEQREKERIKKQLTNNINHELKTPVASIQVCLETLLAHRGISEEKREEFLQRCLANTERLKRLLDDVSLITRMDDGGAAIGKESVDLAGIVAEVVTDAEPLAAARGIVIKNDFMEPVRMTGNMSLLTSIFRNLIDNAISYSGGSEISVAEVSRNEKNIVVKVSDNGIGVDPEHLSHLFERFYRIDKGRSRAAGGTGLGLSIVKNAVLFHGGEITVGNRPGGGLVFRIKLSRI